MEKPVRKRGRPPITKEYSNPLESPMAQSSMKVQKLGAQSFSRPMMKVGHTTPSPRNRRTSNSHNSGHCAQQDGCNSAPGSTTKKGRYRGVLLTTPTKKNGTSRSATASSTPSSTDSIFRSSSRMSLKSSPPVPTWNPAGDKSTNDGFQQFKFALTIGENGRATIAGSSPLSSPNKAEVTGTADSENGGSQVPKVQNGISTTEKNRVLSLLKRMRNTTATTNKNKGGSADALENAHSQEVIAEGNSMNTSNGMSSNSVTHKASQAPSTPRATFAVRTGFTPNAGIDHVLLDIISTPKAGLLGGNDGNSTSLGLPSSIIAFSPKGRTPIRASSVLQQRCRGIDQEKNQGDKQELQRQQYVFKFLSADPLLLTDDVEGNWSEINYSNAQGSPKHHQICFNTPPSWVNWGSPRAFTPLRQDSTGLSACQLTKERSARSTSQDARCAINSPSAGCPATAPMMRKLASSDKGDRISAIPTTPKTHDVPVSMIECTPLIQQTMNGSLTARFVPGLLPGEATTDTFKDSIKLAAAGPEQEDARAALKRLIAEK